MRILLKNGYVCDPKNNVSEKLDILIDNGLIADLGKEIEADKLDRTIDCTALTIIPGMFDMHVHFRDPGQTQKEDILTGSDAAAAGGITGVLTMPNTLPPIDSEEQLRYVREKAKNAKIKVYQSVTITKGMKGEELADYAELKSFGAAAVTDDGRPVANARIMREAVGAAYRADIPIISHCEDLDIINGGIVNEGRVSERLGVKGMSRVSENIITSREAMLASEQKARIHIAHVSTKESVNVIASAKARGVKITCETAPHYFTLTEDELLKRDADYRMNPPLRCEKDVNAIINGIIDGTIDCIVTDHAPHTAEEKADFEKAPNGVVGLETSFAAAISVLYHTGKVTLKRIVELMAVNPRTILGIGGGGLAKGDAADIAIADLNEEWTVDPEKLHSKSKNTCFKGIRLTGRVKYTIVDGNVVFEEKEKMNVT